MSAVTGRMALVILGLLLVLTYLLLRGSTPDAALHERRLRAIDALTLNQAALHRDVLRASHGLLLNYDPLVATVARLRAVVLDLRGPGAVKGGSGLLVDSIAAGLDEQEALLEEFKSAHALLQNSLSYFAHLGNRLSAPTSQAGEAVAMAVGRLASRMFRFVGGAADDAERAEVAAVLDQLSTLAAPAPLRDDIAVLRAHARPDPEDAPGRGRRSGASARDAHCGAGRRSAGFLHRGSSPRRDAGLDLSRAALPHLGAAADLPRPSLCAARRQCADPEGALGVRASDRRHLGAIDRYADRADGPRSPARARAARPPCGRGSGLRRPPPGR